MRRHPLARRRARPVHTRPRPKTALRSPAWGCSAVLDPPAQMGLPAPSPRRVAFSVTTSWNFYASCGYLAFTHGVVEMRTLLALIVVVMLGSGAAAGFECADVTLPSSIVICGDPELTRLADERQAAINEARARIG